MTSPDKRDPHARPRVLVIDDSAVARQSMVAILKAGGYDTYERDTPIGATVEIVRYDIDAVILDMQMPVMSGPRFAELIRGNSRLDGLVIVLVTGETEDHLIKEGERVGADAVLTKRRMLDELVPALKRALAHRVRSWRPKPR